MSDLNLDGVSHEQWLDTLPRYQQELFTHFLKSGKTEEEIVNLWLSHVGPDMTIGFGAAMGLKTYFSNFCTEFNAFICGDKKYDAERKEASRIWKKQGKSGLVSLVSGFIAVKIGLAAVTLVPVVTLLFMSIGKMGVSAYCQSHNDLIEK